MKSKTQTVMTSEAQVINMGLIVEDHVGHVLANDPAEHGDLICLVSVTFLTLCADLAHSAWQLCVE